MPIDVSWPLLADPPTPPLPLSPPPDPGTDATSGGALGSGLNNYIGTGVIRPFQRDQKQDYANAAGIPILNTSVGQILGTMSDSPIASGELPWRPEFGSTLYLLRNRLNNVALADIARKYVVEALARWEPRIRVRAVKIQRLEAQAGSGRNVLFIRITYDILSENSASNEVVVSGLETAVAV